MAKTKALVNEATIPSMLGRSLARAAGRAAEGVTGTGPALPPTPLFKPAATLDPVVQAIISAKPDLLYHPYKEHIAANDLEDMFAAKDKVDYHASKGWRVFHRPKNVPDENVIFHPDGGDVVTRGGDLILMVRPREYGEIERDANVQAHLTEVGELTRAMTEEAKALETTGGATLKLSVPPDVAAHPVDELG